MTLFFSNPTNAAAIFVSSSITEGVPFKVVSRRSNTNKTSSMSTSIASPSRRTFLLLSLCVLATASVSILPAVVAAQGDPQYRLFHGVIKRNNGEDGNGDSGEEGCAIENKPVAKLFDRICDMCYEMFKVEEPNLKIECRANCFNNDTFKLCLRQYRSFASSPPAQRDNKENSE